MDIYISYLPNDHILNVCLNDLGINEKTISLKKTKEGKPYLTHSLLKFNYSNKNNLWVGGFQQSYDIGVDVEVENVSNLRILNSRFLNEEEKRFIRSEKCQLSEIWSTKESFVKCLGIGITSKFNKFSLG